jgi:hypothetical protein
MMMVFRKVKTDVRPDGLRNICILSLSRIHTAEENMIRIALPRFKIE